VVDEDEDIEDDEDDVEVPAEPDHLSGDEKVRLRHITRRLNMRKAGLTPTLNRDDFEEWACDDIDFLVDLINKDNNNLVRKASYIATSVKDTAQNVSNSIGAIPEELKKSEAMLSILLSELDKLKIKTRACRHDMTVIWGQVGMFVDPDDNIALSVARRKIQDLTEDLRRLRATSTDTNNQLRQKVSALEKSNYQLKSEVNKLTSKLDAVPPTYLQRLLTKEDTFPSWVVPGAKVKMIQKELVGEVVKLDATEVTIRNPLGDLIVGVSAFLREWSRMTVPDDK